MTPDDLRDLLRNARASSGLSQSALAEAAGLETWQRIARWEQGYDLNRICGYFRALEAAGLVLSVHRQAPTEGAGQDSPETAFQRPATERKARVDTPPYPRGAA